MEATEESPLLVDNKDAGKVNDIDETPVIQSPPSPYHVLVEMIGARDLKLPSRWMKAYSVVQFGAKTLHRTKPATLGNPSDPIWTIRTDSLFSLQISPNDVANNKQMTITIWAKRRRSIAQDAVPVDIGRGDIQFFGKARINASSILSNCTEERVEFKLTDELGREFLSDGFQVPTLALRFRAASPDDIQDVKEWNQRHHLPLKYMKEAGLLEEEGGPQLARMITEKEESNNMTPARLSSAITSSIVQPKGKFRVKPYQRFPNFMTPEELKTETLAPSTNWVEAGSGSCGRIYLEILSAHDLPNVDIGTAVGNETDAFVSAVYEDALVETDVIHDELSPHWVPWTQRAFAFNMIHPASVLYLGVFGHKQNLQALQHVPIGRVEINPGNFQRDTVYTLQYKLFPSHHVQKDRKSCGTIKIRLRIEIPDERAALLATLKPPPQMYVNIKKRKSLLVARYTSRGEYDNEEKFDLKVLLGYIDEVLDEYLRRFLFALGDSVRSLFFWRGQVQIGSLLLPVYSFLMFCFALTLVERPDLFPALLLLGAAWIMLANMRCRLQHPSPWHRCHSFSHYFRILVTGNSSHSFEKVHPRDGWEETAAYEEARQKRIDKDKQFNKRKETTERAIEEIENSSVEDKTRVIPVEIIVVLGKIQRLIGGFARLLRSIDALVTWEESALSFWITLVLLVAGIIALFLPWAFILRWTGRIAVILFLGPQNKIIDMVVDKEVTDDRKLIKILGERLEQARLHQEDAEKLKAFRRTLYGKFSTIVPSILWTHHLDRPLPESEAQIISPEDDIPPIDQNEKQFIPGQQLYGLMIPRTEKSWKRNRDASQKEKQRIDTSLLEASEKEVAIPNPHATAIGPLLGVEDDVPVEEGVEVLDVYDEEACFVEQDFEPIEKPPSPVMKKNNRRLKLKEKSTMDESIYDLGVEIMDTFGEEAQFVQKSQRGSVHNFSPEDLQNSSSDDSDQDSASGMPPSTVMERNEMPIVNREPVTKSEGPPSHRNGQQTSFRQEKLKNLSPLPVIKKMTSLIKRNEKQTSADDSGQASTNNTKTSSGKETPPMSKRGKQVREESIYDLGLEIVDVFDDEAQFVQKSWRGSSVQSFSGQKLASLSDKEEQEGVNETVGDMERNDDLNDVEIGISTKEYVVDNSDILEQNTNRGSSVESLDDGHEASIGDVKITVEKEDQGNATTVERSPRQEEEGVEVLDDGVEVSVNL